MIKIFTQTDLIRYLYQETTEEEKREIDKALRKDKELQAMFAELLSVKRGLDSARLEPSGNSIMNILSYSRQHGNHKTK